MRHFVTILSVRDTINLLK